MNKIMSLMIQINFGVGVNLIINGKKTLPWVVLIGDIVKMNQMELDQMI